MAKSATSVQLDPSQDSVKALIEPLFPPYTKADVVVPFPATAALAVLTSAISVQDDPLYCSTCVA